ncbi:BCS1 N terminal-domain-containing protein [Xylariaceae sp. FL1019]|nr:BCS1 N terminal-domain-containing protein [Xylariaceae sp. FL1019]
MAEPYSTAVAALTPGYGAMTFGSIATHKALGWFSALRNFFRKWFRFDILHLAVAAVLFKSALPNLFAWEGFKSELLKHVLPIFSSRVSISGHDQLNEHVLHWIIKHNKFRSRNLAAQCESHWRFDSIYKTSKLAGMKGDDAGEKTIHYTPTFGAMGFWHERNYFIVYRTPVSQDGLPPDIMGVPSGTENLVVNCLGWSTKPIKRFLKTCQDYVEQDKQHLLNVAETRILNGEIAFQYQNPKAPRGLESVHFDQEVKMDLVKDMEMYLSKQRRKYYKTRNIPYRRGYLFYGPPGTGKTSLCSALASHFNLTLIIIHLPDIPGDAGLRRAFFTIPDRCLVIIEDIDAVGLDNRDTQIGQKGTTRSSDDQPKCTLSGLLNVLDGAGSQEGRIVIMTTNHIEALDSALVRPGRVDKKVYLGKLKKGAAKELFIRMYMSNEEMRMRKETGHLLRLGNEDLFNEKLEKQADEFCEMLQEEAFTPAQVQGYLLEHPSSPTNAIAGFEEWMKNEPDEVKRRAALDAEVLEREKAAEAKAKEEKERAEREKAIAAQSAARPLILQTVPNGVPSPGMVPVTVQS